MDDQLSDMDHVIVLEGDFRSTTDFNDGVWTFNGEENGFDCFINPATRFLKKTMQLSFQGRQFGIVGYYQTTGWPTPCGDRKLLETLFMVRKISSVRQAIPLTFLCCS